MHTMKHIFLQQLIWNIIFICPHKTSAYTYINVFQKQCHSNSKTLWTLTSVYVNVIASVKCNGAHY